MHLLLSHYSGVICVAISLFSQITNAIPAQFDATTGANTTLHLSTNDITVTLTQHPSDDYEPGYPHSLRARFQWTISPDHHDSHAELISVNEFNGSPLPVTLLDRWGPREGDQFFLYDPPSPATSFNIQGSDRPLQIFRLRLRFRQSDGELKMGRLCLSLADPSDRIHGTDINYFYSSDQGSDPNLQDSSDKQDGDGYAGKVSGWRKPSNVTEVLTS